MGHYSVAQRAYKNDAGDYYLHENGLRGDLMRVLGILNQGESTINLARTTIREPEGTTNLPHMRVTHAVLGETYLPEAINYFRNRKGVGSFPFDKVPTADVWGTHSSKEGVNMRWIVELLEAVGRSTGSTSPKSLIMETHSEEATPTQSDILDSRVQSQSGTSTMIATRSGLKSRYIGAESSVFYMRGIDLATSSQSSGGLNSFESENISKIVRVGSGISPLGDIQGIGEIEELSDSRFGIYKYTPEQSISAGGIIDEVVVRISGGSSRVAMSNSIPGTISQALANIGATSGRYIYIVPPLSVPYEEDGTVTVEYDFQDVYQFPGGFSYNYKWSCEVDLNNYSSAWLFWTEPVIPVGWPDDEYTTP